MSGDVKAFVADKLGHMPNDTALFATALTHSSSRRENYERLEFLGDRVLGLVVARWLYEKFPGEPEGTLSRRFNMLVDRTTCAEIGRAIGLPDMVRLGKQAQADGASQSDNVLGDVVESLIGALYLEAGLEAAEDFIRRNWEPLIDGQVDAPSHPKSALQELAAARSLPNPLYEVVERSGTPHAPKFRVRVTVERMGSAEAEGTSKQEAETAAAARLLSRLT